jgi:hypothetical protein
LTLTFTISALTAAAQAEEDTRDTQEKSCTRLRHWSAIAGKGHIVEVE